MNNRGKSNFRYMQLLRKLNEPQNWVREDRIRLLVDQPHAVSNSLHERLVNMDWHHPILSITSHDHHSWPCPAVSSHSSWSSRSLAGNELLPANSCLHINTKSCTHATCTRSLIDFDHKCIWKFTQTWDILNIAP